MSSLERQAVLARAMPWPVLLGISILLGVTGQLLLKEGVTRVGLSGGILRVLLSPLVLGGFVLYGISSILWLMVLSRAPLSVAYPLLSLGYILVVLEGALFLGEPLTAVKLLGVLVICAGVFLVTR